MTLTLADVLVIAAVVFVCAGVAYPVSWAIAGRIKAARIRRRLGLRGVRVIAPREQYPNRRQYREGDEYALGVRTIDDDGAA